MLSFRRLFHKRVEFNRNEGIRFWRARSHPNPKTPFILHTQEQYCSIQNNDGRWSTTTLATSPTMAKSASPEPWLPWQYLVGSRDATIPNRLIRSLTRAVWQGFARNYFFAGGLTIYYTYHVKSSDHAISEEWWSRWPQTMALAAATLRTVSLCTVRSIIICYKLF